MLPLIPNIERSREYTQEFRGYNHNLRIAENEFYDELNFSADNYPVLSTRKGRTNISQSGITGVVGHGEELYYTTKDALYRYSFPKKEKEKIHDFENKTDAERSLIFMGANLCIFPDCLLYSTVNGTVEKMTTRKKEPAKYYSIQLQHCTMKTDNSGYYWKPVLDSVVRCTEAEIAENPSAYAKTKYLICMNDSGEAFEWFGYITDVDESGAFTIEKYELKDKFRLEVRFFPSESPSQHSGNATFDLPELYSYPSSTGRKDYKLQDIEKVNDGTALGFYIKDCIIFGSQLTVYDGFVRFSDATIKNGSVTNRTREVEAPLDMLIVYEYLSQAFNYDFVIECQNRLWACFHGENNDGEVVNEIFCSALGKPGEWYDFDTLSGGAYRASVGTPGAFTGATVVNQNPVFFKEDYAHKVYVSSTGDHQLIALNIPGVEEGSSKSIAHVNGYPIYKTRNGVVIFDGSITTPISTSFGNVKYKNAIAGASGSKYVMCATDKNTLRAETLVYDVNYGIWHKEDSPGAIRDMALCDGKLCIVTENSIHLHDSEDSKERVDFMFETGAIGFSSPDKKYISRIDLRVSLSSGTHVQIFMQYDGDGIWVSSGSLLGMESVPKYISLPILPRRCDHFKLRISGQGAFNLYSITKVLEQGE